jgi:drug/metabolite transporter (DMT)-like permease
VTGTLLALASAVCYGVADFAGGLLSRRASFAAVALLGQLAAFGCVLAAVPLLGGQARPSDLAWGALSGLGTGVAMAFLYRGMSRGAMSVVVPVSAVGGMAIPVVVGVLLFGDRPSPPAAAGIALAVPALWLVSRSGEGARSLSASVLDGLIASVGIGLQYLALAAASASAGIWPLVVGRVTAVLVILPMLARAPSGWRMSRLRGLGALGTGACAGLALLTYLLAIRHQMVSVAVVLSSLYPVIPVLVGLLVLGERLRGSQTVGLLGAGAAVALLSLA